VACSPRGRPFAIKDAAGHTDLETPQGCVSEAAGSLVDGAGEPLPPLPQAIVPESSRGQVMTPNVP
jgi:hypothetical protein